jgi:putative ABC transport system ATP-binding protein
VSVGYSINIKNLSFNPPRANDKGVLRDLTFNVKGGDFITFIGQNGHGKSSIFRAIAGELQYITGEVRVSNSVIDSTIHKHLAGVGIVHQYVQDDLIGELSILKNIQLRQLFSDDKKTREDANDKYWVGRVNRRLSEFLDGDFKPTNDTLVDELSGGQRQLLNVLIALDFEHSTIDGCRLLMLDEHLTSLDVIIQRKVMTLIQKITSNLGFKPTILMITHDFQYALEFSNKIIIINEGTVKETLNKSNKKKWNLDYLIKAIE